MIMDERMELNLIYILFCTKDNKYEEEPIISPSMYYVSNLELELKDVFQILQSGGRLTRSRKNQPSSSTKIMESRSREKRSTLQKY